MTGYVIAKVWPVAGLCFWTKHGLWGFLHEAQVYFDREHMLVDDNEMILTVAEAELAEAVNKI